MTTIYADVSENEKRIDIFFTYDAAAVANVKKIPGAKFVPKEKGGPYWQAPLDYQVATDLRKVFGTDLELGDALKEWGWQERRRADALRDLAAAPTASLSRLPQVLPDLHAWLRPYQRSGAAFIAMANAPLIADQPGLGKTTEVISAIFEAGLEQGVHLVVAPAVSLETVWQRELDRWLPSDHEIYVPLGHRAARQAVLDDFAQARDNGINAWLVVNPQMVAFRRQVPACTTCGNAMEKLSSDSYRCNECRTYGSSDLVSAFPEIGETKWRSITVDECHKNAVRNPKTLTARAMFKLQGEKRIAMSGTPIANRPIDLWGILHFLEPEKFSSKWRWAGQWLVIEEDRYGKTIGGIRTDRKEDFFRSLTPYVLRRTKAEVLPELPPKEVVDVWAHMTPAQTKQYREWAQKATLKIGDATLSATEVLTEYLRLKQFAICTQDLRTDTDGTVVPFPTPDGGKVEVVEQLLEERGIFDGGDGEKVVIFSQFERVVTMLMEWLENKGVDALRLTGSTKDKQAVQDAFQAEGGPRVLVMTTQSGGVSITLDRADTCIFMDETWTASELEQAEDRLHRASRMHNVTIYYVRTKSTIDEYIMEMVAEKGATAEEVLDKRRELRLY